jgi:hypothetical protein
MTGFEFNGDDVVVSPTWIADAWSPEAGLLMTIIRPQWLQMVQAELRITTSTTIPEYPIRRMLNFFPRPLLRYVNPPFMMHCPRERFASGIYLGHAVALSAD